MATRNKILLRDAGHVEIDGLADAAITPGQFVEITATGWKKHATAGGRVSLFVAREQHENQGADVDDNIAAADYFTVLACSEGCKINAFTSDTITRGQYVESDGVGGVRVLASGYPCGVATAASDLSGTNGRVEIILTHAGK